MSITSTYAGYPLLTLRPDWQGPSQKFSTTFEKTRLDNAVSNFVDDSISPTAVGARGVRLVMDDRATVAAWRAFCDGQRGRARAFWYPTWVDDLALVQPQLSTQNILTFQFCAFTRYYAIADFGRRHLIVILPGNPEVLIPRRVTECVDNGDGTETLTVDSNWGVDIPIDAGVSFLTLCRLDQDRLDLGWLNFDLAQVEFNLRELPREAPTS